MIKTYLLLNNTNKDEKLLNELKMITEAKKYHSFVIY